MSAPVLCWDIDGTLLTTARAGVYSLERAAREVTGRDLDLQALPTAGLTDVELARLILERHGVNVTAESEHRFLRIYEDDLPGSLPRRQGRVIPGVREILVALRSRPEWGSMLLTGNTRRGAAAKLAHYGLADFFTDGAFSDDTRTRREIAERAVARIREQRPGFPLSHIVVIGDTQHDIACARAVGARCIAVATGGAERAALEPHRPDILLPVLPPPAEFFSLVEHLVVRP